jgi:predicted metal-dependent hydrolase
MDTLLHEDKTYTWVEDNDGEGFWVSTCGNCFGFVRGNRSERHSRVCPYCGESLLTKEQLK